MKKSARFARTVKRYRANPRIDMATDFELLDAWRAGDSRSGNALFERHFSSVCRFFRSKLGDEVEDVVQRTFLACIEARDRFRGSSSFKTYLFGIARRQLQDHLRKRARCRLDPMSTMGSLAPWFPSPSTIVQHDAELQRLLDAMRALPLDQQVAVELFYWEGLSAPQLAEILEVPEGTVVQVVQEGFAIGDRVLRPAMVGVAKGGAAAAPAPEANGDAEGIDKSA